jgi:hypothetical protein
VINAKAGEISHTKMYGTYSYALQVNEGSKLHFGMNLGVQTVNFNTQNIIGDPNDRNITNFNDRKALIDGDFGFGYTSDRFSIDGAVYNLKSQFSKDNGDLNLGTDFNLFYVGTSYSISMAEWRVNTKLAYRNIKNYTDIVDIGAEVRTSNNKLGFTGIYHTNKSSTFGISYLHKNEWQFLGMYNNAQTPLSDYVLGTFELALQVSVQNLFKKKLLSSKKKSWPTSKQKTQSDSPDSTFTSLKMKARTFAGQEERRQTKVKERNKNRRKNPLCQRQSGK